MFYLVKCYNNCMLNSIFKLSILLLGTSLYSLEYQEIPLNNSTVAQIILVDPNEYDIVSIRAKSREGIENLAKRNGALVAVNGGFWKNDGRPAGILKVDGEFLGVPVKPRAAIGWNKNNKIFFIDQVLVKGGKVVPQSEPKYTSNKDWDHCDYIVGGCPVLIRDGEVVTDYSSEKALDSFLYKKNRRTAIGILEDGRLVLVTITSPYSRYYIKICDKLGIGERPGLTVLELAHYMHSLGCIDAMNLDGGSSSKMYINKKALDISSAYQSAGAEPVSDVVAIFKR